MIEERRWDLLVVLTAPPHGGDVLTTVLRLVQAMLDRGRSVRMWACGYNTVLSQETLGRTKPANPREHSRAAPTAAALIARLVTDHPGRMSWLVCTACAAERGAGRHIPEVRLRSDARLAHTVRLADRTIYVGGA